MAELIPPPKKISTEDIFSNPYRFLDSVLGVLKNTTEYEPMLRELVFNIDGLNVDVSNRDMHIIFEKLKKDSCVGIIKEGKIEKYYITFKGLLLLKDKGYVEKRRREAISESRQLLMTVAIVVFSGLAALGTLGLLFFEWLKYQPDTFCLFPLPSIGLIFCVGVGVGGMAIILTIYLNKLLLPK